MKKLVLILSILIFAAFVSANVCGDIDGDGSITIDDWYMIHQHIEGERELNEFEFALADVYPDARINIVDMILVNLASVGYFDSDLLICAEPPEYITKKVVEKYDKGDKFEVEGNGIYADKKVELKFSNVYYSKNQSEMKFDVIVNGKVLVEKWVRLGATNNDFLDTGGRKIISEYFKIKEVHTFIYGTRYVLVERIKKMSK